MCVYRRRSAHDVSFLLQYHAGHEFFLDGGNAVFVVVCRLDQKKDEDVEYWLRFIKGKEMTLDSIVFCMVVLTSPSEYVLICSVGRMDDEAPARDKRPTIILVGSGRDKSNESTPDP